MKKTTKTFATVNFANMNADAFGLLSNIQLAINETAAAFNAKKTATTAAKLKAAKQDITDKKAINDFVNKECAKEIFEHKAAKERRDAMSIAFIMRYIGTDDCIHGNMYNFDMQAFLTNIGVYTDGEESKKAMQRIEDLRAMVINRKDFTSAKLKNGETVLSDAAYKDIKNSPTELCAAFIKACIESKAIEYSKGGLSFKSFE